MCWRKKLIFSGVLSFAFLWMLGCGVKGDPLPPDKPADIGRGRPTYKRASEEITIQKTPRRSSSKNSKHTNEEDDDDGE